MVIQIISIRKDDSVYQNRHMAISDLKWVEDGSTTTSVSTRQYMHDWVKNGGRAYVKDARGDKAYVYARTSSRGTEFVQTIADGVWADNLLALPRF